MLQITFQPFKGRRALHGAQGAIYGGPPTRGCPPILAQLALHAACYRHDEMPGAQAGGFLLPETLVLIGLGFRRRCAIIAGGAIMY